MDKVTSRAIDFLSDNPDVCRQIADDAESFRIQNKDCGLDDVAMHMYDAFIEITKENGVSLYEKSNVMNVILAIAESSGFKF